MHPEETKVHRRGLMLVPGLAANHEARKNVRESKGTVTSYGERPHENGSLDSSFNLLCGGFGRLPRFIRKQHKRLVPARDDVEPVSERTVSNPHAHDLADFPHAAPPCATAGAAARIIEKTWPADD
jgi:hypothetical protein